MDIFLGNCKINLGLLGFCARCKRLDSGGCWSFGARFFGMFARCATFTRFGSKVLFFYSLNIRELRRRTLKETL